MLPKNINCTAMSVIPIKRSAEGSRASLKQSPLRDFSLRFVFIV